MTKKNNLHLAYSISEYKDSTLLAKLNRQIETNIFKGKTVLAFTDIDGTYVSTFQQIPLAQIKNFTPSPTIIEFQKIRLRRATESLNEFFDKYYIPIIAITGRQILQVLDGQRGGKKFLEESLPQFDIICPSLGTYMYVKQKEGRYIRDTEFTNQNLKASDFDRNKVYDLCKQFITMVNSRFPGLGLGFEVQDLKNNLFKYHDRGEILLTDEYKVSLHSKSAVVPRESLEQLLQNLFRTNNLINIEISVFTYNDQLNVDISAFSKNRSVKYLMNLLQCSVGIVAGDSGNDKLMIINAPTAAIIPGGASAELIQDIKNLPRAKISEYLIKLPNGVQIYIEPKDSLNRSTLGPESLHVGFETYLHHLLNHST